MTVVYYSYGGGVQIAERREDIHHYVHPALEYTVSRQTFARFMRQLDRGKIRVLPWLKIGQILVTIDFDAPDLEREFARHVFYRVFTPQTPSFQRIWPWDRKPTKCISVKVEPDITWRELIPKSHVVRTLIRNWFRNTHSSLDFLLGFFDSRVESPWWF